GGRARSAAVERATKRLAALGGDVRELESCGVKEPFHVLVSPRVPRVGRAVRVLFVSEHPAEGASATIDGVAATRSGGGPPWFWLAELPSPSAGPHRALLKSGTTALSCQRFVVLDKPKTQDTSDALWTSANGWDKTYENFYS